MRVSTRGVCVVLGVFEVFAAGQLAALADANGPPAVLVAGVEDLSGGAILKGAPRQIGKQRFGSDAQVHQIDPYAMRRGLELRGFAAWHFRCYCRAAAPPLFCQRLFQSNPDLFADAPFRAPGQTDLPAEIWSPPSGEHGVAAIEPQQSNRRGEWLIATAADSAPLAQPVAFYPCNGSCGQFAGIVQSARNGGRDSAVEYQSGPNAALIVQEVNGLELNAALDSQSGECNRALTVQTAVGGNNTSSVIQAGYRNNVTVSQH